MLCVRLHQPVEKITVVGTGGDENQPPVVLHPSTSRQSGTDEKGGKAWNDCGSKVPSHNRHSKDKQPFQPMPPPPNFEPRPSAGAHLVELVHVEAKDVDKPLNVISFPALRKPHQNLRSA